MTISPRGDNHATWPRPNYRSPKGTNILKNLQEQFGIEQAIANPSAGRELPLSMSDPRWPASEGWVKVQQIFQPGGREGPIVVHYVLNQTTGALDDFKVVLLGPK